MKLETLKELNAERAARRPVIIVTDTASGASAWLMWTAPMITSLAVGA